MNPADQNPGERPTIRTIAEAAGVSIATVSRALREHAAVAGPTRERILEIASRLGYRADPEIARLMRHLAARNKPRYRSELAALTDVAEAEEYDYGRSVRLGAQRAAEMLGYGFEVFRVKAVDGPDERLARILRGRGVEGILVLPLRHAASVEKLLPWPDYCAVSSTYGCLAPSLPRVVPDQFGNTILLCREMIRAGARRIGLVIDANVEEIVGHRFSAAVMSQNIEGLNEFLPPFIHRDRCFDGLEEWFARERPDTIIAGNESIAREAADVLGFPVPGPFRFALADRTSPTELPGIDQRPEDVGFEAVTLLHSRILTGQKSDAEAVTMLISGRWQPGS
jgi:LacI family transcriptional regulator